MPVDPTMMLISQIAIFLFAILMFVYASGLIYVSNAILNNEEKISKHTYNTFLKNIVYEDIYYDRENLTYNSIRITTIMIIASSMSSIMCFFFLNFLFSGIIFLIMTVNWFVLRIKINQIYNYDKN